MTGLVFDETAAQRIEGIYKSADAARRRGLVRAALGVSPGEHVLDVGCGPGFYCAELIEAVGPGGRVVGVDASAAMLALARRRCAAYDNVEFAAGDAVGLPVEADSFDAALCVQVMEYVNDARAGVAELHRTLRPGGRVVIWDIDWQTVSIHSRDSNLTRRVLAAWDEHLAHPALPSVLATHLRAVGFEEVHMQAHAFASIDFHGDTYGGAIVPFIAGFVAGRAGVRAAEAQAWLDEQRDLGQRGEFFFSSTQFCFTATKQR